MLLNDTIFVSDGIAMFSLLITHLNSSSSENLLLDISDLTCLAMRLNELSIDYILRALGISKRMKLIKMERIIRLFAITSLYHDRYSGVKSRYLAGYAALVNCNLLKLRGLLSSLETQQRALVIPSAPPFTTVANRVSNTPTQPHPAEHPTPRPPQPPAQ